MNNWTEMWRPVVEELPVETLKTIPKLLRMIEQISLEQLKDKFSTMGKESSIKSNNIVIWFAILGNFEIFCCRNDRNMEAEKAYEGIN